MVGPDLENQRRAPTAPLIFAERGKPIFAPFAGVELVREGEPSRVRPEAVVPGPAFALDEMLAGVGIRRARGQRGVRVDEKSDARVHLLIERLVLLMVERE